MGEEIKGPKKENREIHGHSKTNASLLAGALVSWGGTANDQNLASENNGNVFLHSSRGTPDQSPWGNSGTGRAALLYQCPGLGIPWVVGALSPQSLRQDV